MFGSHDFPIRMLAVAVGMLAFFNCGAATADEVRFNEQIRPILAQHCLHCHGPDANQRQGDLRLDIEADAKQSAIVPSHPQQSEVYLRITSDDPDTRMPPAETERRLTAGEIVLLRRWIAEGAKYEGHWAFQPILERRVPEPEGHATTDIDRFVVAALETRGLKLSDRISRQQLIRRVTLDLSGIPPSWEEVRAFVNDQSSQALEKVIDRLLDSPRYGQRWGRHWLDLARYADTLGGSAIGFKRFPFSYTYRDYVIGAFNADTPYNQFVTEQLAADQLGLEENDPVLAGLGFLTVGMQYRNPHDTIDDQIDVVTRGLMGMTVACARCHDHKFDAIPTTDYYALYATLASSSQPDSLPMVGPPPDTKAYRDYQSELARRWVIHEDMVRDQTEVLRGRLRMQVGLYLRELAKGTPEQDVSTAFLSYRTDDLRPLVLNRWREYVSKMTENDPVFGSWVRLSAVSADAFPDNSLELLNALKQENGDPEKFAQQQKLATGAPKWNPRVVDAIIAKQPKSMLDVADAYGGLFAEVHKEWSRALLEASLEAAVDGKVIPDQDARHAVVNSAINQQLRRHLYGPDTPTAMSHTMATKLLNRTVRDSQRGKRTAIDDLNLSSPGSPPRGMVLREHELTDSFHVFHRGNPIDRGEVVQARFLSALSKSDAEPFPDGKRRLGLAEAIVDPDNPLTRRVIVNWVWQHHFGRGLVRTPDDFGTRGQSPTHPGLLDYLAETFRRDGWSLKKLHRRIMVSRVYCQAAVEDAASRMKDPDNELLWRMPRHRLDLESMRDSMLAVSGELDTSKIGGRPFDFHSSPVVPRRSVYGFINRDFPSSFESTFDGSNASSCTAKRQETSVPQQTLFALNSDFIQDRAAAFAKLAEAIAGDEDRVRWMYRRAYSRDPELEELENAVRFVQAKGSEDGDRWRQLAHVLLAANEFVFVD